MSTSFSTSNSEEENDDKDFKEENDDKEEDISYWKARTLRESFGKPIDLRQSVPDSRRPRVQQSKARDNEFQSMLSPIRPVADAHDTIRPLQSDQQDYQFTYPQLWDLELAAQQRYAPPRDVEARFNRKNKKEAMDLDPIIQNPRREYTPGYAQEAPWRCKIRRTYDTPAEKRQRGRMIGGTHTVTPEGKKRILEQRKKNVGF